MTDDRRLHDLAPRDGARRADFDPDQPPGRPTDDVRGIADDDVDEDEIDESDEEDEFEDLEGELDGAS